MNSINNILGQKFNYLSIDFEGSEFQEIMLKQITFEALRGISEKYNLPEDSNTKELIDLIANDQINKIEQELEFKFPHQNKSDHWHLTVFFKSKQRTELSEEAKKALIGFEKNKIISVKILTFIYIPNKILTLFCKPDCSIQNKYAHVTLLVKNVNPYFSNVVLDTLFENEIYYKKEYEEITNNLINQNKNSDVNSNYVKHCVLDNDLGFNGEDCYLYFFDKDKITLDGKMRYNF